MTGSPVRDVLADGKAPPCASLSSCRALSNIVRNMTDEMIAALAQEAAGPIEVPNLTRGAVREGLHARRHYLRAVQGARQSQ
jgi:microsomal dipeptidase-like Zn-dependent dipeptidase